jgi:hypothetical protein
LSRANINARFSVFGNRSSTAWSNIRSSGGVKAHHIQDSEGLRMSSFDSRFRVPPRKGYRRVMRQTERASQPFQNRVSWLLELGRPLALSPQAGEQTRMPPLRSVIMNRDTQRLLLPD